MSDAKAGQRLMVPHPTAPTVGRRGQPAPSALGILANRRMRTLAAAFPGGFRPAAAQARYWERNSGFNPRCT
jgi:hypothetical protein